MSVAPTETVFYASNHVSVTNTRFLAFGQTFVIQNIVSLEKRIQKVSKLSWILFGILFLIFDNLETIPPTSSHNYMLSIIGIILIIFGLLRKHKYLLLVLTEKTQVKVLYSTNETFVNEVIAALNQAILYQSSDKYRLRSTASTVPD